MLDLAIDSLRPTGARAGDVVAAGLGGKLLVVWRSRARGIRARLAAPDAIGKAEDILLYDDGVQDGRLYPAGTTERLALFPRYDSAVLLIESARGITAVRIGADGTVTPVPPKS